MLDVRDWFACRSQTRQIHHARKGDALFTANIELCLERELDSQLNLAWIERGSGCAERETRIHVGNTVPVMLRHAPNKIRGAVNAEHFIDVRPIEQVERLGQQLQLVPLSQVEDARKPQVHRLQTIAPIGVSPGQPHAIGYRIAITVGVKTHKHSEWPGGL